jgi:Steigviridae/Suoliviridae L,D-carboxypeptidase/transpeptidase
MELTLLRELSTDESTPGTLSVNGAFECFTLEDVVREVPGLRVVAWKIASRTAIPVGTYDVTIDMSGRFGREMPHILNVEGFGGIRIHSGNTSADTEGCILLGQARNGPDEVINSRAAFNAFFPKLQAAISNGEVVSITIVPARAAGATAVT